VKADLDYSLDILAPARDTVEALLSRYPDTRSAVIPLLHKAQQLEGFVSGQGMEEIAAVLGLSPGYVQSVATFYGMFHFKPVGRNIIAVCDNISCALLGADNLVHYLSQKLGVAEGETTPDRRFTLLAVECLGACDRAPVMLVNQVLYDHLTPEKIDAILEQCA